MPQSCLPSHSLTPADQPREPPRTPKETQFENHRPEPFRLSLRTRLPSARAEREREFTHQGATYQSLGWSLREWRRASPWSQRGRGSRNTKRERWRQGSGFSGAPPGKPRDPWGCLSRPRQHLHATCSGRGGQVSWGGPTPVPFREAPYSTLEPQLQGHCSSTARSLTYSPLRISTLSQREVQPSPRTQGGMVQEPPRKLKPKDAQVPYIKWSGRMNTTVPLYPRVSHSRIQPNTGWNFGWLQLQMRNPWILRADYILHHIIIDSLLFHNNLFLSNNTNEIKEV